jgi:hypothetical protein
MDTDNYWGIDAFLAEEESMKVEFVEDIASYGSLTEESETNAKVSQKSILPFWLARELF